MGDTKDKNDGDFFLDTIETSVEENRYKEQNGENCNEKEVLFCDSLNDKEIEGRIIFEIVEMMKGSVSDKFVGDLVEYLNEAYKMKYRHSYHNISLAIYQNLLVSENALDNLSNNIQCVFDKAEEKYAGKRDIINGFKKLYDHTMLEIIRINDNKVNIDEVKILIKMFKDESETNIRESRRESRLTINRQTRKTMDFFVEKTSPMMKEIGDLKNGLINQTMTILGIFSAIVLAFSGGMIYSSSVLENINKSSAYRILFICLFIGFTLINAIIALLMYLGRIINTNKEREKSSLKKFVVSNIFWIVTDLIFIISAFAVLHGWEHSSEKALQDRSNKYYIEKLDKDTEDLSTSVSGNQ